MNQSYPLIGTKTRTPRRRPALLRRERLLNFLHANIHHKLVLISAGAGYGKTSLLIDYAHDTDLPVCWYSLDANDAQVLNFVEYLVACIRQRFPQFGESILAFLHGYTGPPEAVEPFVRLIVHEIEASISDYFVLVLDDYHEVMESEPINALLDGLLRYLPENGHIVLASRGIPRRLTLTRLAARQEVVGLGVEHLRFTANEIEELLRSGLLGEQLTLTSEQIHTLAKRSEGWITGILLAAQSGRADRAFDGPQAATQQILELTGATGGVFDYMAEEILGRQSPEQQDFMLGSALLNEMSPPLCDALLDSTQSGPFLRELAEQNLFTFPLDAEGAWYQYHQLFREFLLAKLERDDPARYRRLYLKKAELMAHHQQWNRAIDSYLMVRAFDAAADTIEIVVQEYFDSARWGPLKDWIAALPEATLQRHPRLLFFDAKVYTERGELDEASALADRAYRLFRERQDVVGAARAVVQKAVIQRFRGQVQEAMQACRAALDLAEEQDPLSATLAHHNIGICQNMQGQFAEGLAEMQRALELARRNGDDYNSALIAHDMGTGEISRGRLAGARQFYHQALVYWRKIGNASALATTLLSLGVVHHYMGQYVEAENRFQEALVKTRDAADRRIEAYTLASQGDLCRDTGRYDEALSAYQQALDLASRAPLTRLIIYILNAQGDTLRLKGDMEQARQVLVEALDQIPVQGDAPWRAEGDTLPAQPPAIDGPWIYEVGLCQLSLGILALCGAIQADPRMPQRRGTVDVDPLALARARLEWARALLTQTESRRELGRTLLYLALLGYVQRDEAMVREGLVAVARIAGEMGSAQFVVAEGPAVGALLSYAQERGIAGLDYVRLRTDIAQFAATSATPTIMAEPAPSYQDMPALQFLGLKGGQVLKGEQLVTDWGSATARFLAFLFVSYPEGLRREQIIDLLWPDLSPDKGSSQFHSTMYRLRRSLSKDVIIHENGVYRLNPALPYRFDVDEFRRLAEQSYQRGEAGQEARLRALELYHSPFLETCEDTWCYEIRQALQREAIDLLVAEGDYELAQGRPPEAEAHYLRVQSLDSYDERAHQGLMRCRAGQNDRLGVMRQYRECCRILDEELHARPSAETTRLYHTLLAGLSRPAVQ